MHAMVNKQRKQRILIVDDDDFIRIIFQTALENEGYLTSSVSGGAAGLARLKEVHHDLVLLDLNMPDKDGFDTCQELRALPMCQLIPVMMITGSDDAEHINRAFEAGATDFITKPINPELLVHRVRYMLRVHRGMKELAQSRERLANAQRIAQLGSWVWDPVTDAFRGSAETWNIMGLEHSSDLCLSEVLQAIDPGDREMVANGLHKAHTCSTTCSFEFRLRRPDDSLRLVRLQAYQDETDPFEVPRVTGTIQDLTEMQQAEDRLQMLKEAIDCLPIGAGITISDVQGKILYTNSAEAEMHGYLPGELTGKDVSMLAPQILEAPLQSWELRKIGLWRRESLNVRKNGEVFPVQLSSIAVRNAQGRCIGVVTSCEDITSRKDSERRIEYLAFYDTLTGLPNRVTLLDQLPRALALAQREGRQIALLFLDLDNFKDVNDTQGHDFGDKFLKEVAARLVSCKRESDTLVRLGGDEFVIVLTSIKDQEGAAIAAQRVQELFATPFQIAGQQFYSTASIGIALFPGDGTDVEGLLKCADAAMYHAKSEGKANYQFFSSEMNEKIMRRVALENSMRQGIARGEFCVHYQPQWALKSARMTGVEALLRWESPEFGSVSPNEFIPLAETSGLIFELSELVLRSAFLQARLWHAQGYQDLKVAVNISGKQFSQPDFLHTIGSLIRESGAAPGCIELEFTESVIMEKADKNINTLRALKQMGVKLSIDDFGTGYSSLNYLKHFPIDTIKIDRSFISDIIYDNDDAAITEAIISMAHSLNLKVIAEGVENREQLQFLGERNCDEVQGYYLAYPMPVHDLHAYLARPGRKSVVMRPDHTEGEGALDFQTILPPGKKMPLYPTTGSAAPGDYPGDTRY
jgi:diguanylate cyclase (GGDEF)-like protein/PAS domain S-box-containing protein